MNSTAGSKIEWTEEMDTFLRENHMQMNHDQLSAALGLRRTSTRHRLYAMGLYRMRLQMWTKEQVAFLRANYQQMGDTELAELFTQKWEKKKGWTKKHIEKKRRYLKLKRTESEKLAIHQRNVDQGRFSECPVKAWKKRGTYPIGTIRFWKRRDCKEYPFIKTEKGFVHWAKSRYQQIHGPIPKGYNVIFKDRNPRNMTDDNLKMISNADLARYNADLLSVGLSDSYVAGIMTHGKPEVRDEIKKNHPELIKLKREQLLLQREINKASL